MKQIWLHTFLALTAAFILTSCGNLNSTIRYNRSKLPELRAGMSREEVKDLLGEPIKGEKYCNDKVWFYYTDCKWSDFMITCDETTPIVFNKKGEVAGWGQEYYKNHFLFESWK